MGRGPRFILLILPADQRHTRDALGLSCRQRGWSGVEWREYVLSLPGRWMVPGKQRKRGRQGAFADAHWRRHQGLAALQTSRSWPRARPSSPLGSSWVTGPWGGALPAPGLHSTRPIQGPLLLLTQHPIPVFREWGVVPMCPQSPEAEMAHFGQGGMRLKMRAFVDLDKGTTSEVWTQAPLWTTGLEGKRCGKELGAWVRKTWGSCSCYRSLERCSNTQVPSPELSGEGSRMKSQPSLLPAREGAEHLKLIIPEHSPS